MADYLLGSQSEDMNFVDGTIAYVPGGLLHAVEPDAVSDDPDRVLGYAACGTPVRIWHEHFVPTDDTHTHDWCCRYVTEQT